LHITGTIDDQYFAHLLTYFNARDDDYLAYVNK